VSVDENSSTMTDNKSQLRGLLKLLVAGSTTTTKTTTTATISKDTKLPLFEYDVELLQDTQSMFQKRRGRMNHQSQQDNGTRIPQYNLSYQELIARHRFVCFFIIQGNDSNRYSKHTLRLRKLLSNGYHDSITTFLVPVGGNTMVLSSSYKDNHGDNNNTDDDIEESSNNFLFCHGTGFVLFSQTSYLITMLNTSQLPSVIIIDSTTGRIVSQQDALLAMEWNDSHTVINSWQQGKSGLSCLQKLFAIVTCESSCVVM
jgi:hypothetical protein